MTDQQLLISIVNEAGGIIAEYSSRARCRMPNRPSAG